MRPASSAQPTANPVLYEVFLRSFRDSNADGIGDLRGLIAAMEYLNDGRPGGTDLEVDGLWLMPIHPSPSYHGYDVTDYEAIHPDYGTLADFESLVDLCHRRGMKVVIDFVLNHTSSEHPWFKSARRGPADPMRAFYIWRDDDPGWRQPWGGGPAWHRADGPGFYYGLFWSGMPDLNHREPRVEREMFRIARTWLSRGVDGFRIDAARHLLEGDDGVLADHPDTHAFFRRMRREVDSVNRDAFLVGEVWTEREAVAAYYGSGEELEQAFDFSLARAIAASILGEKRAPLAEELAAIARSGVPSAFSATFLSNHDMDRLVSRLYSTDAVMAAVTILLTLPGTPYIYYGDELGVPQGLARGDEAKRTPMPWTPSGGFSSAQPWHPYAEPIAGRNVEEQRKDPASLLSHYRRLIALRHAHRALGDTGAVRLLDVGPDALFTMLRDDGRESLLVLVNLSAFELDAGTVDLSQFLASPDVTFHALLGRAREGRVPTKRFDVGKMNPHESRVLFLR